MGSPKQKGLSAFILLPQPTSSDMTACKRIIIIIINLGGEEIDAGDLC